MNADATPREAARAHKPSAGERAFALIVAVLVAICLSCTMTLASSKSTSAASNPYDFFATTTEGLWGNGTWWAWSLAYDNTGVALPLWLDTPRSWCTYAEEAGFSCDLTPAPNSLAIRDSGYGGQVQFVADVQGSLIYVMEGGYPGTSDGYHEGWEDTENVIGYIHLT